MQQDPELKEVVLGFYGAWESGNAASFAEMTSDEPGMVFIGTDSEEWWESRDRLAQAAHAQHEEAAYRVRPGELKAYRIGDFGIIADRPTFILPDGTESPFRFTAVFQKEGGTWKLVQAHASIGVANEDLTGQKLTI
jgi:SnoaL-like domain